jgi:hypothetical protein
MKWKKEMMMMMNKIKKIMVYGTTAHNRSVYAAPAVAGLASIRLGQSLRSFPRLIPAHLGGTKPYGFLYSAAQTS